MKSIYTKGIVVLVALLTFAVANGEEKAKRSRINIPEGWYVSGGTGVDSHVAKGVKFKATDGGTGTRVGTVDLDTEIDFLLSVGFKHHQIRVEGELILLSATAENLKFSEFSPLPGGAADVAAINSLARVNSKADYVGLTAGIFYDIKTQTRWTPYVGARYGWMQMKHKGTLAVGPSSSYTDDKDVVETYTGEIGVQYKAHKNWNLDLGYRYVQVGEATGLMYDNGFKLDVNNYDAEFYNLKVQYDF